MSSIQNKQDEYSLVFSNGPVYELCTYKLDCGEINFNSSEIIEILKGEKYVNSRLIFYVGVNRLLKKIPQEIL